MREGRSHYFQLFFYLWALKREGTGVIHTKKGDVNYTGQQESAVRQTIKKIQFCRPRGSPAFLSLDTHCLAILENYHMTGTLTYPPAFQPRKS